MRSKRLSPVLKIAENRELYAARAVAESRRNLQHYEQKLAELEAFRDEYSTSQRAGQSTTTSVTQLREYQKFLKQLNDGIFIMSEQVAQLKSIDDETESKWRKARTRTDALDKLIVKMEGIEDLIQLNRESNEVDERSQRKSTS